MAVTRLMFARLQPHAITARGFCLEDLKGKGATAESNLVQQGCRADLCNQPACKSVLSLYLPGPHVSKVLVKLWLIEVISKHFQII